MSKFLSVYLPVGNGDEVTSYVNVDSIRIIKPLGNKTKLEFCNNESVTIDEPFDDFIQRLSDFKVSLDTQSNI